MTEHRPPACHFDRRAGERVTREHRDDCTNPETHDGCVPCTAHHCVLCQRAHATNDHPITCPECIGRVRTDLEDILWLCRHLRWQAARGGHDGLLVAGAPIPGGDAMVMLARAGKDAEDLIWSPYPDEYHRDSDVVPPMLVLAGWHEQTRTWNGHHLPAAPSVHGVTHYLRAHLDRMAQATDGPDWLGFTRDMAALRRQLEGVLHDERDPERGVSCFECGERLVRKFGRPKPCHHKTPARAHLAAIERRAAAGRAVLAAVASYPELAGSEYPSGWSPAERSAARPPTSAQVSAASIPCEKCTNQGGIINPAVGQSWECTGCRKAYTPGEYANAVRSDLLTGGPDGDGWTHIAMAAEAASTMTGYAIPASTVRKWMDRGKVSGLCRWSTTIEAGRAVSVRTGQRLVFWPDVADEAAAAVIRSQEAEAERARRDREEAKLRAAVEAGQDIDEAGAQFGIHPARVAAIEEILAAEARQLARRTGGRGAA